ncbi:MAG: hypothetical protein COA45_10240 [Zetaproteobacteria bacterium]|nr:MAG: hypothetical protein COA45_10240 [Zetaproteobacteria bacterium]
MNLISRVFSYQKTIFWALCLLSLLSFPSLSYAQSDAPEQPYKATTVDECIQEKACFWHHFLLAIQVSSIERKVSENINIKKWTRPIRFRRFGRPEDVPRNMVNEYIRQIEPFIAQSISADTKYNFSIIFTDDIERDLSGSYNGVFTDTFGRNVPLEAYRLDQKLRGEKCYHFNIQNSNRQLDLSGYFTFIQRDHSDVESCLKKAIYKGFGLDDISYTPIVKTHNNVKTYSKLELALMQLLYQDFFKSGMTFSEVEMVFNKIYTPFIKLSSEPDALK